LPIHKVVEVEAILTIKLETLKLTVLVFTHPAAEVPITV
jgi:hypothetical protein